MKAVLGDHVIAESDDLVEAHGYEYFPAGAVRKDWLVKAPKTASDLECPHGVQFYDVVDRGQAPAPCGLVLREFPRPAMQQVGGRFGFWDDVKVG